MNPRDYSLTKMNLYKTKQYKPLSVESRMKTVDSDNWVGISFPLLEIVTLSSRSEASQK